MGLPALVWAAIAVGYVVLNIVIALHAYRFTRVVPQDRAPPRTYTSLWQKLKLCLSGSPSVRFAITETPKDVGLEYGEVKMPTRDGLSLAGWWIPHQGASATILLLHGWASNRSELLPHAKLFHEEGYHVCMVDHRGCGDSQGGIVTFGEREAWDVEAAVKFIQKAAHGPIGAVGVSMGGAALARYLYKRKKHGISVAVFESTYSSLLDTAAHRFWHLYRLTRYPFAWLLVWWGGVLTGFGALRLSPARYLSHVKVPVYIAGGTEDFRVPPADTFKLFRAAKGPKEVWLVDRHGHELILEGAPEEYRKRVLPFLAKYLRPKRLAQKVELAA